MSSIGSKASTDEQTSRSGRTCPWPCFADMTDMNSSDEVMRYVTDRNRNDMDVSIGTRFDRTGVIMPTPSVVCMNTLPSTLTIWQGCPSGDQAASCCPAAFAHPIEALASLARSRLGSLHLPVWFICSSKHRQVCVHHLLDH